MPPNTPYFVDRKYMQATLDCTGGPFTLREAVTFPSTLSYFLNVVLSTPERLNLYTSIKCFVGRLDETFPRYREC